MDRPSRELKVINYCDLDDDEDFACAKPPASKKPRDDMKQDRKKPSSKSSSKDLHSQPPANHSDRRPPGQNLYDRDLEAALTLSLLHGTDESNADLSSTIQPEQYPTMGLSPTMGLTPTIISLSPTTGLSPSTARTPTTDEPLTHKVEDEAEVEGKEDSPPTLFSNCSVNGNLMGLDNIHAERGSSKHKSSPRTSEPPQSKTKDQDEDYRPKLTPESESDENLSEVTESEDEEFTVKKIKKKSQKKPKKETAKIEKKTKPPPLSSSKRVKQTSKPAETKPPATASLPVRTPPPANQVSMPKRPTPTSKPSPPAASLSGGGGNPKWNPPGQLGRSPTSPHSTALRSPGQGLRLGLSRRVRVKPLHPSVTSH